MTNPPKFASLGKAAGKIDVRLSYRIVELFSEGLYASPNKALEELVANAFDAGALHVQILLSAQLEAQDATIVVIDDGEGMDAKGLRQHWLIGRSNKRDLASLPRDRQQIGKFGIGKLATYVLAGRLTHITKHKGKYYSTSMDYDAIDKVGRQEVEPDSTFSISLRTLTADEAKEALQEWTEKSAFKNAGMKLFGKGAPRSWTVAIMSRLKPKVRELKRGTLEWVLSTALPLRDDFAVWAGAKKLSSKFEHKHRIRRWVLGKEIKTLPKPAPKGISAKEDVGGGKAAGHRYSLEVPGLGRVTGYAEAYKELLTSKADRIGRSNGFFVYVFGRLVNVSDGHFGIPPDELRHGTFGRFRLVIHIDALDGELRSNREAISEGPLLDTARNLLRGVFNAVRPAIEKAVEEEQPSARLSRKIAASPATLSRKPIVALARAVVEGKRTSRYLIVPKFKSEKETDEFLKALTARADGEKFITELSVDYDGSPSDAFARYDTATGALLVNAFHPFIAAFYDDFAARSVEPLELLAMAEVTIEAQLFAVGVGKQHVEEFLDRRDQLLRYLSNETGRKSAFAIASNLKEARNDPNKLEEGLCEAFESLGFEVTPLGGSGKPDGVATALLSAGADGNTRSYKVSLDAKSKVIDKGKVAAGTVKTSTIVRHREEYGCNHAIVVGRDFPAAPGSSLAKEIEDDRKKTAALGDRKTVTLMSIDALAKLVRLRPLKQLRLGKLRELFECQLPQQSAAWVDAIEKERVKRPPYAKIVNTIEQLQKKRRLERVKYAALAVELSHLNPAIKYETDDELRDVCRAMAQMAPNTMFADADAVELDQSAANVIDAINAATKQWADDD